MFRYCYMYYCIIILIQKSAQIVQIQNRTYVLISVKWEKTDGSRAGGSKNSNKCSAFPATYKLDYPHTDFILKHLNKNPIKPSKIKHFTHFNQKSQYRTQYRQTPLKLTLPPISNHNQKPQFKPLSSYINTRILRKIPTFTDYQLFIKNHINQIKTYNTNIYIHFNIKFNIKMDYINTHLIVKPEPNWLSTGTINKRINTHPQNIKTHNPVSYFHKKSLKK